MERWMTSLLELTLPMTLVIALLLAAGPVLGRRFTARWRYWAWLLIAVRLLLPIGVTLPEPVVTLPQPQGEITYPISAADPGTPSEIGEPIEVLPDDAAGDPYQQIGAETTETGTVGTTPVNRPQQPQPAAVRSVTVMEAAGWCWAAGAVLFLLWQWGSYLLLRVKLHRSRRPVTEERVLAVLEKETAAAGLGKVLPVYTAAVGSPMIVGAIKPTLLLPAMDFSAEQLSLVFRHELIHYRRRDIWYKLLLMLANAVHWFNPLVWWMVHAADRDLELSCDEAVVAGQDEAFREEYGRCLLAVVRAGMNRRTLFTTNFYSGKKTLKNRLSTILDTTKKRRGTLALVALLLAAAVAGSLVACTPSGKNNGKIDLTDYDALSREYLAPIASFSDRTWSVNSPEWMSAADLLDYAAYERYGYNSTGQIDRAAIYGAVNAEQRAELETLLGEDGNYHLPEAEIYEIIQQHFGFDKKTLNVMLADKLEANNTIRLALENGTPNNRIAYATEATLEDDTLTIAYDVVGVAPGEEGFVAQHTKDYVETYGNKSRYAVTIRLTEDGGWQYVKCEWNPVTVTMEKPEGELQVNPSEDAVAAGWELIASRAEYYAVDTYVSLEGSSESCRLLGWGQQTVSIYSAEDGYHLSYWRATPERISSKENPEVIKWNGYISDGFIAPEDAALFNFSDMVIYLNPKGNGGYSLYSQSHDCTIAVMENSSEGIVIEQSGSGLLAFSEEPSGIFAEGSRYRLLGNYLGMDDSDGYNKYDFYLYDSETHHLTTLLKNTPYESFSRLSVGDDGTLFGIVLQDIAYIYDAAKPEAPLAVYDKTNLPLDGYDAVYMGGVYVDDRDGKTIVLMYYPYDSSDTTDVWGMGGYEVSPYLWKLLTMTVEENNELKPWQILTMRQHPARNYWTTYPQGEIIVRGGLLYYSNYYAEDGTHILPDGSTLVERWCINLTTGQARMTYTNDPIATSYDDENFIAKAKAMGYTDEMLKIMRDSRVAADNVLTGNGTGSGSEDFYSPGGSYRAYSRTITKKHDKAMVVLLDGSGSMRVVPQVFNDGYDAHEGNYAHVKLGFTAEGLLWVSDDRGVYYYDPAAIMAVAENRSPLYSWSPDETETGDSIPYVMWAKGYRAEGIIIAYWAALPQSWDGWSMLPEDVTIHAAVLGPNGQLQKDWDTGVQLATSTEGGPACLSSYGYQQREGYAGFYVSGAGDTDGTMYELNLATGEVTPAENP